MVILLADRKLLLEAAFESRKGLRVTIEILQGSATAVAVPSLWLRDESPRTVEDLARELRSMSLALVTRSAPR